MYKYFLHKEDFNNKIVFWDIDGTLAAYRFNGYMTHGPTEQFLHDIEDGVFLNRPPSKHIQRIINEINSTNIVLGHCVNDKEISDKRIWLQKHFPKIKHYIFLDLYKKGSKEFTSKADEILKYCKSNNIDKKNCIFIDDSISLLVDAQNKGIESWHISSLFDYFERM